MQRGIKTKLTLYQDSPVSASSTTFGSNMNCVAFNTDYIGTFDRDIVVQIYALYEKCKNLRSK